MHTVAFPLNLGRLPEVEMQVEAFRIRRGAKASDLRSRSPISGPRHCMNSLSVTLVLDGLQTF